MKKNRFFTFVCALMPGAGQMYLGFLKRGVSLMTAFTLLAGLSSFLSLYILVSLLPVVWCFAFFDTFSLAASGKTPAEDDFLLPAGQRLPPAFVNRPRLAGLALVLLGLYMVYNTLLMPLLSRALDLLPFDTYWIWSLANDLPTLAIAAALVAGGLRLMKRELSRPQDDLLEYKEDSQNG